MTSTAALKEEEEEEEEERMVFVQNQWESRDVCVSFFRQKGSRE